MKMNCDQANQIDLVDYLYSLGFSPARATHENFWFLSPLRQESTPSFKVNKTKNIWFDHGIGKGGNLVDFAMQYFNCDLSQALQEIARNRINKSLSFHQQKTESVQMSDKIKIVSVRDAIWSRSLRDYLHERSINPSVYHRCCKEVTYLNRDFRYPAIGFKNNAGGYELRSPNFKGSSSPKFISYFDYGGKAVSVFEGFFDFLSFECLKEKMRFQKQFEPANILVLNSLSFFTRSLLLLEKHERIHLYLDNDKAGDYCTRQLQERTGKVIDHRKEYRDCKDLNEWLVKQSASLSEQKRLRL